ncbi:MAG: FAD:protein FMN transferase [Bdellovibrionales bacterium]|nr:FAD:protein FMN transferase [Bdellovibrionales bacterium]
MGTVFEVQYLRACGAADSPHLELEKQIQDRLDTIEASMSLYQSKSEISRLNRQGHLDDLSPDFRSVLEQALDYSKLTEGYFDITIWSVLEEIQASFKKHGRPPEPTKLQPYAKLVDSALVQLEGSTIKFSRPGVKVSTDGIAKGYAVDEVAEYLLERGVSNFLINFSGNIRTHGKKVDGQWKVAIQNPLTGEIFDIDLRQGAVASSGLEYASYSKDHKWHHLINPRTLLPARELAGSSVAGPSATVCDALSTAVLVMGRKNADRILSKNFPHYRFWTFK